MSEINAVIGQSGGPTGVINASLAGVFKGIKASVNTVYGMCNGMQGFLNETLVNLNEILDNDESFELLRRTPSSYLGSCRYKLPKVSDEKRVYIKIFDLFNKYNIKYFFYIGGNDSMDTVAKLSDYGKAIGSDVSFIGVPKTIDNDLIGTDHTPGYGSAAKYIASTVKEIAADSSVYCLDSVTIIEIMGRDAGWLTASSVLARDEENLAPHLIYLPECAFDFDKFIEDVKNVSLKHKNIIVTISEGARTKDGRYVCESVSDGISDVFGHKYLGGAAKVLERAVRERLNFKARGIELNIPQRCAGHLLSKTDIDEATQIGIAAANSAIEGNNAVVMTYERISDKPYSVKYVAKEVNKIANAIKLIPKEWINAEENGVTDEFVSYAKPLIQGEVDIKYENGIPKHLKLL